MSSTKSSFEAVTLFGSNACVRRPSVRISAASILRRYLHGPLSLISGSLLFSRISWDPACASCFCFLGHQLASSCSVLMILLIEAPQSSFEPMLSLSCNFHRFAMHFACFDHPSLRLCLICSFPCSWRGLPSRSLRYLRRTCLRPKLTMGSDVWCVC